MSSLMPLHECQHFRSVFQIRWVLFRNQIVLIRWKWRETLLNWLLIIALSVAKTGGCASKNSIYNRLLKFVPMRSNIHKIADNKQRTGSLEVT